MRAYRLIGAALCSLALAGTSAFAAKQLVIYKPGANQTFVNPYFMFPLGDGPILVRTRPPVAVKAPTLQVLWQIQRLNPNAPPTWASVFVQPNMIDPLSGYDVTNVLGPGKYRVRVRLEPVQPGWTWSNWTYFQWGLDAGPLPKVKP
jgi:hypothetical protein